MRSFTNWHAVIFFAVIIIFLTDLGKGQANSTSQNKSIYSADPANSSKFTFTLQTCSDKGPCPEHSEKNLFTMNASVYIKQPVKVKIDFVNLPNNASNFIPVNPCFRIRVDKPGKLFFSAPEPDINKYLTQKRTIVLAQYLENLGEEGGPELSVIENYVSDHYFTSTSDLRFISTSDQTWPWVAIVCKAWGSLPKKV